MKKAKLRKLTFPPSYGEVVLGYDWRQYKVVDWDEEYVYLRKLPSREFVYKDWIENFLDGKLDE